MSGDRLRVRMDRAARTGVKRVVGGLVRRWGPRRADLPLSTWRLARDASGALVLDGIELRGLLERRGSPLYVVDAARIISNAARFTARPSGASRSCEVYYSYKTNPVPGVLRVLHGRGVGAEVVSPYELWLALRMGVDPRSIVYNGPAKAPDSLALALDRGVGLINCNHRAEIAQLASAARSRGKTPRIGVRVVPPGASMGQFGERIDNGDALRAYQEALAQPELRVVALHAHYNGEIRERHVLDAFLSSLLAFCDELKARLGLELEILDIGGNLACTTITPLSPVARRLAMTFGCEPGSRPPGSVLSIDAYVACVLERIEGHYAAAGRPTPRVFLEPGRALTGDSQMLLCRVLSVRDPDPAGLTWGRARRGNQRRRGCPERDPCAPSSRPAGGRAPNLPADRAELHARGPALSRLQPAAPRTRGWAGDHGHGRLLRSVRDLLLLPATGDRDDRRRARASPPTLRDVRRHGLSGSFRAS